MKVSSSSLIAMKTQVTPSKKGVSSSKNRILLLIESKRKAARKKAYSEQLLEKKELVISKIFSSKKARVWGGKGEKSERFWRKSCWRMKEKRRTSEELVKLELLVWSKGDPKNHLHRLSCIDRLGFLRGRSSSFLGTGTGTVTPILVYVLFGFFFWATGFFSENCASDESSSFPIWKWVALEFRWLYSSDDPKRQRGSRLQTWWKVSSTILGN